MLGSIGNQLQRSISDQGLLSDQRSIKPQFAEHEHLKCPRCDSTNTKFCYYNNYNLSQPRHFCKNCRRYWTKGGALRNIPVGGGSRKNSRKTPKSKHPSSNSTSVSPCSSSGVQLPNQDREISGEKLTGIYSSAVDADQKLLEIPGTFSSLLASNGHFGLLSADPLNSKFPKMQGLKGSVTENLGKNLWGVQEFADNGIGNPPLELQSSNSENFLGLQVDSNCWGGNGWPDLAIYTPGSNLQ